MEETSGTDKGVRVFSCIAGSRAYGLEVEGSDTDIRGVFVTPLRERFSLLPVREIDDSEDGDVVFYELRKFFCMACDGTPNAMEMLWSCPEDILHKDPRIDPLFSSRDIFITERAVRKMVGYAKGQLCVTDKKGVSDKSRNKGFMHAARTAMSALSMAVKGEPVVKNVGTDRDFLLKIRMGDFDAETVKAFVEKTSEQAVSASRLLEKSVDMGKANTLFVDACFRF